MNLPVNRAAVLIVEDETPIRSLLYDALTAKGLCVVAVATKREALALLASAEHELVIADIFLPDGSGLEVIEHATRLTPPPQTIVITGYADVDSAIGAVSLGVFRYVRKPFDLPALLHDVALAIAVGRERRELARRSTESESSGHELLNALHRAHHAEHKARLTERMAATAYIAAASAQELSGPLSQLSRIIPHVASELRALIDMLMPPATSVVAQRLEESGLELQCAEEAIERLISLSTDLRLVGQLDPASKTALRVADLVAAALRLARYQIGETTNVRIDIPLELKVPGNASRLVQALLAVLDSSARALRIVPKERRQIAIGARAASGRVSISISDTGIGVTASDLGKLFKPFSVPPGAPINEARSGLGLDLALAKEIIEEHAGTIRVTSQRGTGTSFAIQLPRAFSVVQTPPTFITEGKDGAVVDRRKLLFYDPSIANLETYEEAFAALHEMVFARNAEELARSLLDHGDTLDAIICDVPKEGGPAAEVLAFAFTSRPALKERTIFLVAPGEGFTRLQTAGLRVLQKPARLAWVLAEVHRIPPKREA